MIVRCKNQFMYIIYHHPKQFLPCVTFLLFGPVLFFFPIVAVEESVPLFSGLESLCSLFSPRCWSVISYRNGVEQGWRKQKKKNKQKGDKSKRLLISKVSPIIDKLRLRLPFAHDCAWLSSIHAPPTLKAISEKLSFIPFS